MPGSNRRLPHDSIRTDTAYKYGALTTMLMELLAGYGQNALPVNREVLLGAMACELARALSKSELSPTNSANKPIIVKNGD